MSVLEKLNTSNLNAANLDLSTLTDANSRLTAAFLECLVEACCVCLDDRSHSSPVNLNIQGDSKTKVTLIWPSPATERMKVTYNDYEVATEHGAYALAILLLTKLTSYVVIERARKGKGFDFWLGKEQSPGLFQEKVRLEVSGIRDGIQSAVDSRVSTKLQQIRVSDKDAPAYVVVVEFSSPLSKVVSK